MTSPNVYTELLESHRPDSISGLWSWQEEVLGDLARVEGDAAVELPTGAGKTLIGLLVAERYRRTEGGRVAYVAGNKQLAQQVERGAKELAFPVVRFEGAKEGWDPAAVRDYNFGQALGVMNYWNYFNAAPGVEPADKLILDDVHLLEGPLRDMFTVTISRSSPLLDIVLRRILERCPYYARVDDLLNEVSVTKPPEMLAFPDSADLAEEIRDLLDVALVEGSPNWWSWQNIRDQLEVCCWLVSGRGVTFTPYIPPTQTLEHFRDPSSRLYLSATIGTVDDLQRRLGAPPMELLTSSVSPMQGERLVVIRNNPEPLDEAALVDELKPLLEEQKKALWLCARKDTASNLHDALVFSGLEGSVRLLEGDNAADESFAGEEAGQLVAAGRYDGMDFPGDACRLEVVPEVPVATSDLEEFVSAFLRDAPFAQARFGQRVAQALGRCNRTDDDRAVYVLTDPEFLGRFGQRRIIDAIPGHAREDVFMAAVRADEGFAAGLEEARRFLAGSSPDPVSCPERGASGTLPPTAVDEVEGTLAMWNGGYREAADQFDRVAHELTTDGEYRGFWLGMRGLALKMAADLGDKKAGALSQRAFRAAVAAGVRNTFFTRLRLSVARIEGDGSTAVLDGDDDLFSAWDKLIDRHGTAGTRFERWTETLLEELKSPDHDTVARAIARVGSELLGLNADAPKPTSGEEDANWELFGPRRSCAFEVKLAPKAKTVANKDVEQAEGATRVLEKNRGYEARGLLVTPHRSVEDPAAARLERVRLVTLDVLVDQVEKILSLLRAYRRQWAEDHGARDKARRSVADELPPLDWFLRAAAKADVWVDQRHFDEAWSER
jgi:hypothetical protein